MTPKEKAQQLADNMGNIPDGGFGSIGLYEAKQCALVAVDELIENHNKMKDFLFSEIGYLITSPDYWKEVKQEIEKL